MPHLRSPHDALEILETYRIELRKILDRWFSKDSGDAEQTIAEFFSRLSGEETILILHREPFLLAADLARRDWETGELDELHHQYKKSEHREQLAYENLGLGSIMKAKNA